MEYHIRDLKPVAAAQFLHESLDAFFLELILGAGQIDQIGGVRSDKHVWMAHPGLFKGCYFFGGELFGVPLALVTGENLQRFSTNLFDPVEGKMQPLTD
jgi:hypothetical protein